LLKAFFFPLFEKPVFRTVQCGAEVHVRPIERDVLAVQAQESTGAAVALQRVTESDLAQNLLDAGIALVLQVLFAVYLGVVPGVLDLDHGTVGVDAVHVVDGHGHADPGSVRDLAGGSGSIREANG
jgi:hypothetical protein